MGASFGCALAAAAQVSRHNGAFWSRLGNHDKAAYVAGYSDATHCSLGKLDKLRLAAGVFYWKGADKILAQVARGRDISGLPAPALIAYLDKVYSNPRYGDFDVEVAIEWPPCAESMRNRRRAKFLRWRRRVPTSRGGASKHRLLGADLGRGRGGFPVVALPIRQIASSAPSPSLGPKAQ